MGILPKSILSSGPIFTVRRGLSGVMIHDPHSYHSMNNLPLPAIFSCCENGQGKKKGALRGRGGGTVHKGLLGQAVRVYF